MSLRRKMVRGSEPPRFRELPVAEPRCGADFFGPGMSNCDVAGRAFLQEQFARLDARLRVKPFAHLPVEKDVGDGDHDHALVMCHECPNDGNPGPFRKTAAGVVERLKEAVPAACADCSESREVERRAPWINH